MCVVSVSFASLSGNSVPGTHFLLLLGEDLRDLSAVCSIFSVVCKVYGKFSWRHALFPRVIM